MCNKYMHKSKKIKRICEDCGAEFSVFPSRLKQDRTRSATFCSKACYYKNKSIRMKGRHFMVQPMKELCHLPTEEWKLAYFAGIIDGEGSVGFRKAPSNFRGMCSYIAITNTSESLIAWVHKEFGGNRYDVLNPSQFECRLALKDTILKTRYDWVVRTAKDCLKLLTAILPYLIIKKTNAENVIQYCKECIITHEEKIQKFKRGELLMTENMKLNGIASEQGEKELIEQRKAKS